MGLYYLSTECRCRSGISTQISKAAAYLFHKLWCPDESRICSEHLIGDDLCPDVIVGLTNRCPLSERLSDRGDDVIKDLLLVSHSVSEHDPLPRLHFTRLND